MRHGKSRAKDRWLKSEMQVSNIATLFIVLVWPSVNGRRNHVRNYTEFAYSWNCFFQLLQPIETSISTAKTLFTKVRWKLFPVWYFQNIYFYYYYYFFLVFELFSKTLRKSHRKLIMFSKIKKCCRVILRTFIKCRRLTKLLNQNFGTLWQSSFPFDG